MEGEDSKVEGTRVRRPTVSKREHIGVSCNTMQDITEQKKKETEKMMREGQCE